MTSHLLVLLYTVTQLLLFQGTNTKPTTLLTNTYHVISLVCLYFFWFWERNLLNAIHVDRSCKCHAFSCPSINKLKRCDLLGLLLLFCQSHLAKHCTTFNSIAAARSSPWPPLTQLLLKFRGRPTKSTHVYLRRRFATLTKKYAYGANLGMGRKGTVMPK